MATISQEKRFGPEFSTGREEEPGPLHYTLESDFDVLSRNKVSAHGSFSKADREALKSPQFSQTSLPRQYNTQLPGEFAKAYSMKEIMRERRKARLVRDVKPREQPRIYATDKFPIERLKLEKDGGSYNTDAVREAILEKISTSNSFGKAKRMGIVDFIKHRGEIGCSPGVGTYCPKTAEISRLVNEKPDLKRLLARAQQNDELFEYAKQSLETSKSALQFQRSFKQLSQAFSMPRTWSAYDRFEHQSDFRAPGPGSYEAKSDFESLKKSKAASTFGKTERKDLLASLEGAGFVSITDVGPGQYSASKSMFDLDTRNVKCGYKKQFPHVRTRHSKMKYLVPKGSRVFGSQVHGEVDQDTLWKALMKRPDPRKLGYASHVPRDTSKTTTMTKKLVVKLAEKKSCNSVHVAHHDDDDDDVDVDVDGNDSATSATAVRPARLRGSDSSNVVNLNRDVKKHERKPKLSIQVKRDTSSADSN